MAQKGIKELIGLCNKVTEPAAKPTMPWTKAEPDAALAARVKELAEKPIAQAINAKDKAARVGNFKKVKQDVLATLATEFPDKGRDIGNLLEDIEYRVMRAQVVDKGERVDGRDLTTDPADLDRGGDAAPDPRFGAVHPGADPGAGGRDAGHRR